MKFISYAQNFEDVMLWRALGHVKHGVYIDVGAWSPDLDSVTRAFYHRDWHGINIEPSMEWHAKLADRRCRDINLRAALSDQNGTLTMYIVGDSGRLTTGDAAVAHQHAAQGAKVREESCPMMTLATAWDAHLPDTAVHFLKIDVEGFEQRVLQGNDWTRLRPWIVLVEATEPNQERQTHAGWEPCLLSAGYDFVYADGLNRFYVAHEHPELKPAFAVPPNLFDKFITSELYFTQIALNNANQQLAQAQARIRSLEQQLGA